MSALSNDDVKRVEDIAELKVRQYFDSFGDVLAEKLRDGRYHTHLMIERHDANPKAHGGVATKFDRFKWTLHGAVLVLGLGGGFLLKAAISYLMKS